MTAFGSSAQVRRCSPYARVLGHRALPAPPPPPRQVAMPVMVSVMVSDTDCWCLTDSYGL